MASSGLNMRPSSGLLIILFIFILLSGALYPSIRQEIRAQDDDFRILQKVVFSLAISALHVGFPGQDFENVDILGELVFEPGQKGIPHVMEPGTPDIAETELGQHAALVVLDHRRQTVGAGDLDLEIIVLAQAVKSEGSGDGGFGQGGVEFEGLSEFFDSGGPTESVQVLGAFLTEPDGFGAVGNLVAAIATGQAKAKSYKD